MVEWEIKKTVIADSGVFACLPCCGFDKSCIVSLLKELSYSCNLANDMRSTTGAYVFV